MAIYYSERQIGDDGDLLTEMSEACLSQENTMSLRNVTYVRVGIDSQLTCPSNCGT
jgi:hypothetical protein